MIDNVETTETSDSGIRKIVASRLVPVMGRVHDKVPWLTADHITLAGGGLVGMGSYLSTKKSRVARFAGYGMIGVGLACDGIDGLYARVKAEKEGTELSEHGQLLDVVSDKVKEWWMAEARYQNADSAWGRLSARATQVCLTLPSLGRAFAESRGVKVRETGEGWLGIPGTTLGRTGLGLAGLVATGFDRVGSGVQNVTDPVIAGASLLTGGRRIVQGLKGEHTLSNRAVDTARVRSKVLLGLGAILAAATLGSEMLRRRSSKRL